MFNKMISNPMLLIDGYKLCHKDQYPLGTEWTYETWIPRKSRIEGIRHALFFGLQGTLAELYHSFKEGFFDRPLDEVMDEIRENVENVYGRTNSEMVANYDYSHFAALHKLGYLPIRIKALKEGSFVPVGYKDDEIEVRGVPMWTIENTLPEFFWLPGYLEPLLSSYSWQPTTDATIADGYKRLLTKYAVLTGADVNAVFSQAGDFSMRGMGSPEAAYRSSCGHLLSFGVSSTIQSRNYLKSYYGATADVLTYAPSTEHSVMCSYGRDEKAAFLRLITEVYPSGNVTIVSDTYDFWGVIDNILPEIKDVILSRKGRVAIRPDSGDPVKILCGDPESNDPTIRKGLIERLYEIFGGPITNKGYKALDPHIGAVYGDAITLERAAQIMEQLEKKGFASTTVVLGIGSYTYQYMTRDTLGFALKATAEIAKGEFKPIYKDPKTDTDKFKKSLRGLVAVVMEDNDYKVIDGLTPETIGSVKGNLLEDFFVDGEFIFTQTFAEIRARVASESPRVYGGAV